MSGLPAGFGPGAPLCLRPTPAGAPALLVVDEATGGPCFGGHKARRLAPVIAAAAAEGVPVFTAGGDGSQQVVAVATLAAAAGVPVGVVTWPQPTCPARAAARAVLARWARWHVEVADGPLAPAALAALAAAHPGARVLGPGAADPADAGPSVALGAAIGAAAPPAPGPAWVLVVPVGSGGTAAAWRVGLDRAGRADIAVVGVRAVPRRAMDPGRLARRREAIAAAAGVPPVAATAPGGPAPGARAAGPGLWLCGPGAEPGRAADAVDAWVRAAGEAPLEAVYERPAAALVAALRRAGAPVLWARTAARWP